MLFVGLLHACVCETTDHLNSIPHNYFTPSPSKTHLCYIQNTLVHYIPCYIMSLLRVCMLQVSVRALYTTPVLRSANASCPKVCTRLLSQGLHMPPVARSAHLLSQGSQGLHMPPVARSAHVFCPKVCTHLLSQGLHMSRLSQGLHTPPVARSAHVSYPNVCTRLLSQGSQGQHMSPVPRSANASCPKVCTRLLSQGPHMSPVVMSAHASCRKVCTRLLSQG